MDWHNLLEEFWPEYYGDDKPVEIGDIIKYNGRSLMITDLVYTLSEDTYSCILHGEFSGGQRTTIILANCLSVNNTDAMVKLEFVMGNDKAKRDPEWKLNFYRKGNG